MADALTRLVVDYSVVVKWKIPTEDHAAAAEALLGDLGTQVVDVGPEPLPLGGDQCLPAGGRGEAGSRQTKPGRPSEICSPYLLCSVM